MDRDTIIDGLRMTMDLFVFDPSTGEERDPDELNDLDRTTYDACKGALDILERLDTDSDTISRAKAIEAIEAEKIAHGQYLTSSYVGYEFAEDAIRKLPPTQPETDIDDVTCDNCDYSEKYVDGLILCRRTKTSHRVSATSTCGKGKREVEDAKAKV